MAVAVQKLAVRTSTIDNGAMEPCVLAQALATKMSEKITTKSLPNWPEVMLALAEIGAELEFDTRTTDPLRRVKEFLWDVVWIDKGSLRLELAAESEMGDNKRVIDDFQRLLYAKAPTKLMICDRGSARIKGEEQGPKLLMQLEELLAGFKGHIAGEEYLVFDCYGERRELRCYSWRAPENGDVGRTGVKLLELDCSPIPYVIRD